MFASLTFVFIVPLLTTATATSSVRDKGTKYCSLPPYPEYGRYTVRNYPFAMPGDSYQYVKLDVSCDNGYLNNNTIKDIFCINGDWSATMPRCVPDMGILAFCTLKDDMKIEYRCLSVSGSRASSKECPSSVPSGTVVKPRCRSPAYFSLRGLSEMNCRGGIWDNYPSCKPACGLLTQHRQLEGSSTNHVELPWHAVIYEKISVPYAQYCSGSLVTANKIISAANCFCDYDGNLRPASDYLVAVNKIYREYNDPRDINSQQSDVVDIKIPPTYRGRATNYENDIAIVVVKSPFIFHLSVRPVCLDFDNNLDRTQLTEGNFGKVAHWSIQNNNYQWSFVLNEVNLSCIKFEDCYDMLPFYFQLYLTNDKFYAGHSNGLDLLTYLDRSAGLAFLESTTQRYFLRGVLTAALYPKNCFVFTSIVKHEHFIKQHL